MKRYLLSLFSCILNLILMAYMIIFTFSYFVNGHWCAALLTLFLAFANSIVFLVTIQRMDTGKTEYQQFVSFFGVK